MKQFMFTGVMAAVFMLSPLAQAGTCSQPQKSALYVSIQKKLNALDAIISRNIEISYERGEAYELEKRQISQAAQNLRAGIAADEDALDRCESNYGQPAKTTTWQDLYREALKGK